MRLTIFICTAANVRIAWLLFVQLLFYRSIIKRNTWIGFVRVQCTLTNIKCNSHMCPVISHYKWDDGSSSSHPMTCRDRCCRFFQFRLIIITFPKQVSKGNFSKLRCVLQHTNSENCINCCVLNIIFYLMCLCECVCVFAANIQLFNVIKMLLMNDDGIVRACRIMNKLSDS